MKNKKIILDTRNTEAFINQRQLDLIAPEIISADRKLKKGTGEGADFLGWMRLGSKTTQKLIKDINSVADEIRQNSDVFLCIGIGGSYLGSRAGIEFVSSVFDNHEANGLKVYFCGNNLCPDYLYDFINSVAKHNDLYVNVISKSGTTIEPALAFRVIYDFMKTRYNKQELSKRIICTTDKSRGALKTMAAKEGFRTFVIPDNVGGRFSVLAPVGLLPMACAGIDIEEVLKGAAEFEKYTFKTGPEENTAYKYAAMRNILYRSGKDIEILSSFHPPLHSFLEWWKQLFAESEGKGSRGIFPTTADFTTDLHSIGQLIQEGKRNIFETFLIVEKQRHKMKIPYSKNNIDNLNYLSGKDLKFVQTNAYKGTARAHTKGGVPNMTLKISEASPFYLGQLYYFFEIAVGISGYLLGINPFDQPGVEAYKQSMYRLLKKPV